MKDERREEVVAFKVTTSEKEKLLREAEKYKLSISGYVRMMLLSDRKDR